MSKYVLANHKLNPATSQEVIALVNALNLGLDGIDTPCVVGLVPSFLYVSDVKNTAKNMAVGVQDIAFKTATTGAFTGDVSALQVANAGVDFVLVGHSERRQYYGESDDVLSAKIKNAFEAGLSVVYCIGESKDEYEQGKTKEVLAGQLKILAQFAKDSTIKKDTPFAKLIIAYEPVWAIGTGLTPTFDEIESIHRFIGERLSAYEIPAPIVYGGSVNDKNAPEFATSAVIDGALVGGASLKAESFLAIVKAFSWNFDLSRHYDSDLMWDKICLPLF